MAEKFGNTWWGQAWLKALTNIDYENRIPRGARYARAGAVTTLKIKENIVEARVKGSRVRPYREMIVLPKFLPEDIDRLIEHLMLCPALITGLFQRQLSPEIADIAAGCGLKLFPERWNDLKMNCDCPDWAVPCKHLAAVIYMISREIDNNPFLVFEMHGINLLDELRKRGLDLRETLRESTPLTASQLLSEKPKQAAAQSPAAPGTAEEATEAPAPRKVDFSQLPQISDANLMLLPANPPFYVNGDFKELYAAQMKRVADGVDRFLNRKLTAERMLLTPETVRLTPDSIISFTVDKDMRPNVNVTNEEETTDATPESLAVALLGINPDFLPDYNDTVTASATALQAAIHFAAAGLLKPEIVAVGRKGAHRVVWLPLHTDARANEIINAISAILPTDSVMICHDGRKRSVAATQPARTLVMMFATMIVNSLAAAPKEKGSIDDMFFKGATRTFDGIGENEIPGAIRTWTDRLVISDEAWMPVLTVDDKDEEHGIYHFRLNISVDTNNPEVLPIPLEHFLSDPAWEKHRFAALQSVMRLANVVPGLSDYVNRGARKPIRLTDEVFVDFLTRVIPAVRMLGLTVYLPKSLRQLLKPTVTLSISERAEDQSSFFSLYDFFGYDWRVAIGDEMFDASQFESLIHNAEGLIRFKKSYIYMSADDMKRLRERMLATRDLTPAQILQAALSEEFDSAPVELSDAARKRLEALRHAPETPLPTGLQATLRPYQQRGFSWLYRNMKLGFGSVLADDMGLGKTLQAIALILKLKEEGELGDTRKAIVVAPVGLLGNWEAEVRRFAPTLTTAIYHGPGRDLKTATDADVMITSYGMARTDAAKLRKSPWQVLVIDEAQTIKNVKAAQTKAIVSLPAKFRIALSGTPVENRLSEFWSIMNFTNPGYLGSLSDFATNFSKPIQTFNDVNVANRLKAITAPFLMRRMKTDKSIISDLPDKVERDVAATLTPEQAALYEQTLSEAMTIIKSMPTDSTQALFKRQGIILQMILALKQICDHPALFLKNNDTRGELSGKVQLLLDRVEPIIQANDKVLIFTQYRQMGEILQSIIAQQTGETPLFYHGGCTVKERARMVDQFQNSRSHHVFILTLKAAGTGLNLTAANNVIHYDLWWNPAVEAQATDRAFRIGQKRNVLVDRFITAGTFEERINEMINSKRQLAELTVSTGETWIGNLSNSELESLFAR